MTERPRFKPLRRRNNHQARRYRKVLERRFEHLSQRIDRGETGDLDYDRAERNALRFALEVIDEWVAEDPLFEVDVTHVPWVDEAELDDLVDLLGTEARYLGEPVEIVGARFIEPTPDGSKQARMTLRPLDKGDTTREVRVPEGAFGWLSLPALARRVDA